MIELTTKCKNCGITMLINFNNKSDNQYCLRCQNLLNKRCMFCGDKNCTYWDYVQGMVCEECRKEILSTEEAKTLLDGVFKKYG